MPPALLILLGAVSGLIAGSFVGALVVRWPAGESIAHGRSRCDACERTLGVAELVPLASFLALRGRCGSCRAPIARVQPAAELACAIVGATAFAAASPVVAAAGALFGWTLVALALLDLRHFWLPDRLTLPLALLGPIIAAAGAGVQLRDSVIGAAAGYLSLALVAAAYRAVRGREGMGGGDPKLFMAVGGWLGWTMLPPVLLVASLLGLSSVALRRARGDTMAGDARLPLGTLLALAAWPVWLLTTAGKL